MCPALIPQFKGHFEIQASWLQFCAWLSLLLGAKTVWGFWPSLHCQWAPFCTLKSSTTLGNQARNPQNGPKWTGRKKTSKRSQTTRKRLPVSCSLLPLSDPRYFRANWFCCPGMALLSQEALILDVLPKSESYSAFPQLCLVTWRARIMILPT